MGNFTVLETLALVRAGYSKKEIKAMADASEEVAEVAPKESAEPELQKEAAEPKKEVVETNASEPAPDYKMMFDDLQKKYDDLTIKLEAAQKANINADVSNSSPKISTTETINNIFKDVLS